MKEDIYIKSIGLNIIVTKPFKRRVYTILAAFVNIITNIIYILSFGLLWFNWSLYFTLKSLQN